MVENKNERSLKKFLDEGRAALITIGALTTLFVVAAVIVAIFLKEDWAWIAIVSCCGAAVIMAVVGIFFAINYSKKTKEYFYDSAFKISSHNLGVVRDHSKQLMFYNNADMKEFREMNKEIKELSEEFESTTLAVKEIDFEKAGVVFLGESENVVEYSSLRDNITRLILSAQSFRNAVISFNYDLGDERIKDKDAKNILDLIISGLKYPNLLIAENDDERGFLAFLPYFDSINQLNEELEELIQHISLIKRSMEGKEMVLCRIAVAVYPYSGVNDIMRDLNYAAKQTKLINFFLPERPTRPNNDVLQSSMNLNNICKFYEKFSSLKPNLDDIDGSFKEMRKIINQVNNYYRFSCCGMLEYNVVKDAYVCTYASNLGGHDIFSEGATVRRKYIEALNRVADRDSSYYFSNRVHINNDVAQFIDVYEIASGQFYLVKSNDKVIAVLYFLNYDKEIAYDSYMREALLVFSHFIGSYFKEIHDKRTTQVAEQAFSDVLKISNTMLYTINPENHHLLFMSDALQSSLPRAKCGKQCFKTLYGLTAPCTDCPLKNRKKHMIQKIRRTDYETSIAFNSLDESRCQLLMRPVDKRFASRDRYDQDLLINSYYSFYDNLDNEFMSGGEGYVLLMTIDNIDELVHSGNKAYTFCIRDFGNQIRKLHGEVDVLYLFRDDVLAMVLPSADKNVVIDLVEKVETLTHETRINENDTIQLHLSYLATQYTRGITAINDYINSLQKIIVASKKNRGEDKLYFVEDDYIRPASREQHLLEILTNSISTKSFHIKMQPVVDNSSRRIYGAELLIRIEDEFRNKPLSAMEVIKVAEKFGKVPEISDSLVSYIGSLYKSYGYTFFKSIGFDRLSLNTDYSYFNDKGFLDKLNNLSTQYSIPKNFLALEITEGDMYNTYDEFLRITQKVVSCNTVLVCDQYTGEMLTPDQIKELGFTEVKIARSMIMGIEEDEQKLSKLVELVEHCRKKGLEVTLVGAESKEQIDLISSEIRKVYIQGNYFYQPLDEETLFDELRKANYYEDRVMND